MVVLSIQKGLQNCYSDRKGMRILGGKVPFFEMCKFMKTIFRLILFVTALALGGWLGIIFLADFELLKTLVFFAICSVLGLIFHKIDSTLSKG